MVAPVDIFIVFSTRALFEAHGRKFESGHTSGGGNVRTRFLEGDIASVVDRARLSWPIEPLGIVAANESDALRALEAGADEAFSRPEPTESDITTFLDRVMSRARIRREEDRNQQDFAQAEKLTALGTLVAGIGHELNNPLSTVILGFDVLREALLPDLEILWKAREQFQANGELTSAQIADLLGALGSKSVDVRDLMRDIYGSTEVIAQLVQDLRVFSRSNISERPSLFRPREIIEQALRLVGREFGTATVIEQDYENDLPSLLLQRNRLAQVITNLLVNAAHAIRECERPVHQIRISARIDEDNIAIAISDTGPGIPEDALERIFDPFFTTKREGEGTGLGLSISRSIIQHMGGDLMATSTYGEGATFVCFLPLPTEEERAVTGIRRATLPIAHDAENKRSVLLIDDDEGVLRTASRSLKDRYKVLIARDGAEATELLVSGSRPDAIVMELDLPEVDGPAFFCWLSRNRPELCERVVVATAAQERPRYREFLERCGLTVLHKPLSRDSLVEAVSDALAGS